MGSLEKIIGASMKMVWKQAIVVADRHTGIEDLKSDRILKSYISDNKKKITYVIDLGDGIDNPNMSVFPVPPTYKKTAQEEFDAYAEHWKQIHDLVPKAQKIIIAGNHDKSRLTRNKRLSKGLWSLRNLEYEKVLEEALQNAGNPLYKYELVNQNKVIEFTRDNKALFTHGDPRLDPNVKGGITGPRRTAEMYPFEGDIYMGHTHHSVRYPRQFDDKHLIVLPTMANLNKLKEAYINWHTYSNGFGIIHYNKQANRAFYEPVEITKGQALAGGRLYK